MLVLHGFAVSNYFNMVRMALLEKGAAFDIETVYPNQEAAWRARSPMGKVPCLQTGQGFLAETSVILDYIEDSLPDPALYPRDAYQRARVRQAIRTMELYIELPARRLYPGVFFGASNAEHTVTEVEATLRKGIVAVANVLSPGAFLMGEELSYADIFAAFTFPLANAVARKTWNWDLVAEVPGLGATLERINARDSAKLVNAQREAEMAGFVERMKNR